MLRSQQQVELKENFVSDKPSSWYSELYKRDGLTGGHIIMLGADDASRCVLRGCVCAWALFLGESVCCI